MVFMALSSFLALVRSTKTGANVFYYSDASSKDREQVASGQAIGKLEQRIRASAPYWLPSETGSMLWSWCHLFQVKLGLASNQIFKFFLQIGFALF